MLTIRAVLDDLHLPVTLGDVPEHGRRLVSRVLRETSVMPDRDDGTGGRTTDSTTTSDSRAIDDKAD